MKRLAGVLVLVAAGLLGTAAPAASETATPTWVAEETFEFKALASSSSTTLDPDQAADQIQALEAAHQAKISTPAAEAKRQQSIDAFTDLGAFAATDLVIEVFKDQLQDLTTLATEPLLESETPPVFLSDTSARINPPGQEDSSLLVSSIPLRNQQGELVSGELVAESGVFAPLSPLSEVEFPATSSGEVNFPEADISFEFEGAENTQGRLISAGDGPGKEMVFYPNTAPDTDTAVTYILGGVETFNYLRSEISPETLTLNYTLPEGATLAGTPDGGAAATDQDGETLLTVYPPYAIDAQGSFVPMSLTVEGDSILLNVPHRGEDFAYPIMVDPVQHIRDWWTNGASAGYEGWSFHQTGTSSYASSNTCPAAVLPLDPCGGTGAGAYTSGVPGSYYPANSRGYWRWSVPGGGTSSIQSATLSSWRYRKGAATNGNPYAFFELTPGGTKTFTNASSGGSNLALTGTGNSTKYLQVGLESNSNLTLPAGSTNWRYNRLAGFTANLTDSEPPELTLGQAPSGWLGPNTPFSVPATARDAGLGMGSIQTYIGSNWTSKWLGWCWGTYPYPCPNGPFDTSLSFNSNSFPSGINTVPVKAVDVVGGSGHEIQTTFPIKIDHVAPSINTIGSLTKRDVPGNRLYFQAVDNSLTSPAYDTAGELSVAPNPSEYGRLGSGTTNLRLLVDNVLKSDIQRMCTGEHGSCKLGAFQFDLDPTTLSEGVHEITVESEDAVGNTNSVDLYKTVDRTAPSAVIQEVAPSTVGTEDSAISVLARGNDAGFGVSRLMLKLNGNTVGTISFDCDPNGCPKSTSHAFVVDVSGVDDGQHNLDLTAFGPDGSSSGTTSVKALVDRDTPEIHSLDSTVEIDAQETVNLVAVNPGHGVQSIEMVLDGQVLGQTELDCSVTCPEYSVADLDLVLPNAVPEGSHGATLIVTSPIGVRTQKPVTLRVDHTAPTIEYAEGAILDSSDLVGLKSEIAIGGRDTGVGIESMRILVDEEVYDTSLGSPDQGITLDQTCMAGVCQFAFEGDLRLSNGFEAGTHDVRVEVIDAAGNIATTAGVETELDTSIPEVILSGSLPARQGTSVTTDETLIIEASDSETSFESGLSSVSVEMNERPILLTDIDCSSGCPQLWSTQADPLVVPIAEAPSGEKTITIEVTDRSGNSSYSEIVINPEGSSVAPELPACPQVTEPSVPNSQPGSIAATLESLGLLVPEALIPSATVQDTLVDEVRTATLSESGVPDLMDSEGTILKSTIGTEPGGLISIGGELCLRPSAASSTGSNSEVLEDGAAVVIADSSPSSDLVVRPFDTGVSLIQRIGSQEAAESVDWQIGTTADQFLAKTSSGAVALAEEGTWLSIDTDLTHADPDYSEATSALEDAEAMNAIVGSETAIAANEIDANVQAVLVSPVAVDANGTEIPVEWTISGKSLSVDIPSTAAFPVIVISGGFALPDPLEMCKEALNYSATAYWSECVVPPSVVDADVSNLDIAKALEARASQVDSDPQTASVLSTTYNSMASRLRLITSPLRRPSDIPGYDIMNRYEKAFCAEPGNWGMCLKLQGDRSEAYKQRARHFTGARESATTDGTRANAFQHALWVALMAKSGNTVKALEFGYRHELPVLNNASAPLVLRKQTEMDLWNNERGASIYWNVTADRNETVQCTHVFYAAKEAIFIDLSWANRTFPKSDRMKFMSRRNTNGFRVLPRYERPRCPG